MSMNIFDRQKREMTEIRLRIFLLEDFLENLIHSPKTDANDENINNLKDTIARTREKLKKIRRERAKKASQKYASKNKAKANLRSKLWYDKQKMQKKNNSKELPPQSP